MFEMRTLIVLIPAFPLVAAILIGLLGPRLLRDRSHWLAVAGIGGSMLCSLMLGWQVVGQIHDTVAAGQQIGYEETFVIWQWLDVDGAMQQHTDEGQIVVRDAAIDVTLRVDTLTCIMLVMVTFVATLVAIYASGYMHGDRSYWRFFAYVSLFVFSMTMLVSVSNFVLLFIFWEAVGVCSYLLIGFWYEKPEAAAAGKKAFLVNRVGDFGFALALFLIWTTYGTLNFHDTDATPGVLGQLRLSGTLPYVQGGIALAIGLLLMVGACGKSAQFPLHVWLPDAMEGPTPVSALIHAATMVTAGVYMVTRCTPLFTASPVARIVVACIGGFTAVLAGLIALTQYDLKRVLAYSTISQLGYMFLALGTGTLAGITAGMFHLFTHAFFKALLFLGAGSVMHAMGGVIDMRRFGGLRKIMPVTHWTFLFGCLALAGIVPFAGFWSKDAILAAVHEKAHHGELIYQWLYYASVGTAFLTAFYTFRAFFMTFYGPLEVPAEAGHHAHESPAPMWVPLSILAAFACLIGFSLWNSQLFDNLLSHTPSLATEAMRVTASHERFHWDIAMTSTVVAVLGVGLAAYFYLGPSYEIDLLTALMDGRWTGGLFRAGWTERMASHPLISGVHRLAGGIGLGWLSTIVGYVLLALFCVLLAPLLLLLYVTPYRLSENKFYLDEIYDWTVVRPLRGIAQLSFWLDRLLVDGLVNLVGQLPKWLGASLRGLQWGMVSFYGLAMILGTLVLVFARVLWGAN